MIESFYDCLFKATNYINGLIIGNFDVVILFLLALIILCLLVCLSTKQEISKKLKSHTDELKALNIQLSGIEAKKKDISPA